jgi:hypothetical protein
MILIYVKVFFAIDNRQSTIVNYSYLNATIGSTLVARRAGR